MADTHIYNFPSHFYRKNHAPSVVQRSVSRAKSRKQQTNKQKTKINNQNKQTKIDF